MNRSNHLRTVSPRPAVHSKVAAKVRLKLNTRSHLKFRLSHAAVDNLSGHPRPSFDGSSARPVQEMRESGPLGMCCCCVRYAVVVVALSMGGCSNSTVEDSSAPVPPVLRAEPTDEPPVVLPSDLRRQLQANDNAKFHRVGNEIVEAELFQSGVRSVDALRGLPLRSLDLGMTDVTDLSPLKGMPLKRLILENTPVPDLSALQGMELEVLHLQNTKVTDLSVLAGMPLKELNLLAVPIDNLQHIAALPLETLWIPDTEVTDISPLRGKPMVSLDIKGTAVTSLEPLSGMQTLKRLNIAQSGVTDVTPLKGLNLERITLTPETITTGMEVLREMPSLSQIQTSMYAEARQSASEFWTKFDSGVWKKDGAGADADTDENTPASPEPKPAGTSDRP